MTNDVLDFTDVIADAIRQHKARYPGVEVEWNEPCIYVFSVPPYVKVGRSDKVFHREEQLQNGRGKDFLRPADVAPKNNGRLIAAWPGARTEEKPTHRELIESHVHVIGEWFLHTPELDEWIERKVAAARAAKPGGKR